MSGAGIDDADLSATLRNFDLAIKRDAHEDKQNWSDVQKLKKANQDITESLKPVTKSYTCDEWTPASQQAPMRRWYKHPAVTSKEVVYKISNMLQLLGPCPVLSLVGTYKKLYKKPDGTGEILNTEGMGLEGGIVEMLGCLSDYFDVYWREDTMFVKLKDQAEDLQVPVRGKLGIESTQ